MNINPAEIDKFDELSAHWWDTSGPLHTLHAINPLRLAFIQEQIDINGLKILDVGCGGGILAESLAKAGAQVTGLDASPKAIDAAIHHGQSQNLEITYYCGTLETMNKNTLGTYDVITCMEMLEHVPDGSALIETCSAYLKPGGKAFFSTLNRTIKAYLLAIVGAEYLLQWLPRGTHHYDQFIKPSELARWLRKAHLSLTKIEGIQYNPLQKNFSRTPSTAVNYMVYCEK
ncbi:MAG: bifunctional 2-polyprenyl-6-hydroxyphenol methylase/3-demethylubiquinol 3-O-methyltransferase UbiG [Gammaproteobacteria bacterium]